MKKHLEVKGICPYCKEITFISEFNDEPECCFCGRSIREKDLINSTIQECLE